MINKIYIHAVKANGNTFSCSHPECHFSGDLTATAEHVVKNQFIVKEEKKPRPADLFKI